MFTFLDKPKQSSNPYMRFSKVFQPQQNTAAPKRDQRIRAVLTANALLQTPERVALVQEIQDLCAASSKNYQTYYEPLIKNFAEFVQQLEHIDHPAHTWLDHHLRLAKTSLKMREQFLLVGESLRPIVSEEEALWHYVIFSSALLRRIGLLFSHYQVSLCTEQGTHTADWLPFMGSMNDQGHYYKLREITDKGIPPLQSIHQLLARQLMPAEGFAWIARNPMALLAWLGVVEGESSGGVSYSMVALSEKQLYVLAQQEELLEELFHAESLEALLKMTQLSEQELLKLLPPLHGIEIDTSELAIEFFDWLKNNRNEEGLEFLISEKQYLLSPVSLAFLARECPGMFKNWFNFYKKALRLGLTVLTPSDKALHTFLVRTLQMQPHTPAHTSVPASTHTPTQETKTTEMFHQTLHDHNEPNAPIKEDVRADAIVHQQNIAHTVETLNHQGLMVGALFGAAHYHAYTEKNIATTQHEAINQKQSSLSQDQFVIKEGQAHQVMLERQQQLQTRQQQLRRMVENQYPEAKVKVTSSFSYTKKT